MKRSQRNKKNIKRMRNPNKSENQMKLKKIKNIIIWKMK